MILKNGDKLFICPVMKHNYNAIEKNKKKSFSSVKMLYTPFVFCLMKQTNKKKGNPESVSKFKTIEKNKWLKLENPNSNQNSNNDPEKNEHKVHRTLSCSFFVVVVVV